MKKRFFSALLAFCMVLVLAPVSAADDAYTTLKNAIAAAPTDGTETAVKLEGDITDMTTDQILTIPEDANIVLDMQGHSITVNSEFSGRPFVNQGTLTVTGDGTIDSSNSAEGGLGAINNQGTLTIENGTYAGAIYASGAAIRNTGVDAVLTIEDGTFEKATCAVFNEGTATINGGMFTGTTCSSCNSEIWSYTIRNYTAGSKMVINGGMFTGTQGAVSASIGYLEVNDGTFKTVDCAQHHGAVFYALYAAGEVGEVECVINGGHFETEGKVTAVQIGNDNAGGDGGIMAQATGYINGGTFVAPEGVPALIGAKNTGDPIVTGGTFSKCDNLAQYIPADGEEQYFIKETAEGLTVLKLDETTAVAQMEDTYCATLADAFAAVPENSAATITLLQDVTGETSKLLDQGKQVTLDLNNHSIGFSGNGHQYLSVDGAQLHLTGTGTVYEESPYYAPVRVFGSSDPEASAYSVVTIGKNVTLEGYYGLDVNVRDSGNNYAYGVEITIDGTLNGKKDSGGWGGVGLYVNGTISQTTGNVPQITINPTAKLSGEHGDTGDANAISLGIYQAGYAKTLINGGSFTGDTGIEIRAGELTVVDGTITGNAVPADVTPNGNGSTSDGVGLAVAQHTSKLPVIVKVSGGEIAGYSALYQSNPQNNPDEDIENVSIEITGGGFKTINGGTVAIYSENKTGFISGGHYSTSPADYLAEGKTVVASDQEGYTFMVADKQKMAAEVVVAAPIVETDLPEDKSQEEIDLAQNIASALSPQDPDAQQPSISEDVLESTANTIANQNELSEEEARAILVEAGIPVTEGEGGETADKPVTVVVQPYLDIQITDVAIDTETMAKEITLEITPMYKTVATTANLEEEEAIVLSGEATGENPANAAVVGEASSLEVNKPVTVTIPLPEGYTSENTLYVHHEKERTYVYTGAVENNVLTFTNPHGFSTFVITAQEPVAQIQETGTSYATLQDAVDEVEEGQTIILLADGQTASVSKAISFVVKSVEEQAYTADISAGSGYTMRYEEETQTYTFTRRSSGGGGGGGTSTYAISIEESENGTVTSNRVSASRGATVTLTVTPEEGFLLDTLTVTDNNGTKITVTDKGDGKYTFTMPSSRVTISAVFTPEGQTDPDHDCPSKQFQDINTQEWYHEGVDYVVENGLMLGTSDTTFAPNENTTRGMIVTILHRMEQEPAAVSASFTDVTSGQYYAEAVAWAAANDIVNGYGDGRFGPEDSITREQLAAILYRYAEYKGYDVTGRADLSVYQDQDQVSSYAEEAMSWACEEKLFEGVGAALLSPATNSTRAQVATILMRLADMMAQ